MKLKKLLKDVPVEEVKGPKEIEITGVCANSKRVAPGNLFIAKKGRSADGSLFIPEAIAGGAVAVLTDMFDPTLKITQIITHDVAAIEGALAAQFNQFPSEQLFMVAITGTNGKTTISYLIKHLLDHLRGPCGLIGTIEYLIGEHSYQATHTTPDVTANYKLLKEMVTQGCRSAVMEVTSHGLDQGRVNNIHFDVAIFSNLTPEHLDYHETMERYGAAKNKLFRSLDPNKKGKKKYPKKAIINCDDPYHKEILKGCQADILTYGVEGEADLRATDIHLSPTHTHFNLLYQGAKVPCTLPLVGRFNVYNCLATIACGLSQGFPLHASLDVLATFKAVPGRLEPVPNDRNLTIYVDFAHTPDALENVLKCLQEFKQGKIITVFGCGGDRDQLKRPKMAEVAERYSDITIVTTDNPRSEQPEGIIDAIVKGFTREHLIEVNRREAIERAIQLATPDDVVLIAGRGHEPYQTFAHHTVEFDDRRVAAEICQTLG